MKLILRDLEYMLLTNHVEAFITVQITGKVTNTPVLRGLHSRVAGS